MQHTIMLGEMALQWWQIPSHIAVLVFGVWLGATLVERFQQ